MAPEYRNAHDYLHYLYKTGKGISRESETLSGAARMMLQKAEIVRNLEKAKGLYLLYEELRSSGLKTSDGVSLMGVAHRALSECYSVILDDLMILSAFEIYAKSELIKKSYVIHEIRSPASLSRRQKSEPIHIKSIKAHVSKGKFVDFKDTTIGISTLLEDSYRKFLNITSSVEGGIKEVRNRRNHIHFHMGYSWTVSQDVLNLVDYLDKNVKKWK